MAIAFNSILVPVDFSINTEIAIKKAAGLVGADKAVLHLLHVLKPGKSAKHQFKRWAVEKELEQLGESTRADHPAIRVKTRVLRGHSVQRLILDCAEMLNPDLIIIGKQNNRRRWSIFPRSS